MTRQRKNLLSFLILSLLIFPLLLIGHQVAAGDSLLNQQEGVNELKAAFGESPIDIRITIVKFINIALTFLGIIFIGLTIFAGFKYMTSGGNEEKTGDAVKLLKNAVIGLVIILSAWSITRFTVIMMSGAINNSSGYWFYTN